MSYFKEIDSYETYANSEDDFHFIYNANSGGGQAFFAGRFRDENGNLISPSSLDNLEGCFHFKNKNEKGVYDILLDDQSVCYEIKTRSATNNSMKMGVGRTKPNPSSAITTFLMLPETCGVKKSENMGTSVLSTRNYWLQSMWLSVDKIDGNKVFFTPRDCIVAGGVDKQGHGTIKYFSIDFNKRIADIIKIADKNTLDPDVIACVKHFADIYKGEKKFLYEESAEFIKTLMKLLLERFPDRYSGNLDPLTFIKEITHLRDKTNMVTKMTRSDLLAAIRTKPFVLLAGMSGTGKTRIVRQLAQGCCPEGCDLAANTNKPGNYECIPVRPNWHDSTGLMGYITRITRNQQPEYVVTDFVRFLAKAWLYEEEGIPFFLCLDEMNLAPVEQYFAEYLSVIESRQRDTTGKIITDPLIRIENEQILRSMINDVYKGVEHEIAEKFEAFFVEQGGIPIPSNFIVMGTVNMDETTCSFSRKVLDRAMTFELNEVDMSEGLEDCPDIAIGSIPLIAAKGSFTHGWQVYEEDKDNCDKIKDYLVVVNCALDKTPFKFAYRTRDEIMAYCVERMKDKISLAEALDEATSMKILSRIEGDEQTINKELLEKIRIEIEKGLETVNGTEYSSKICLPKLEEMTTRLSNTGFTSFWT